MKEYEDIVHEIEGKQSEIVWQQSTHHQFPMPQVVNTKLRYV